jgi:hypothetical protein
VCERHQQSASSPAPVHPSERSSVSRFFRAIPSVPGDASISAGTPEPPRLFIRPGRMRLLEKRGPTAGAGKNGRSERFAAREARRPADLHQEHKNGAFRARRRLITPTRTSDGAPTDGIPRTSLSAPHPPFARPATRAPSKPLSLRALKPLPH